MFTRWTTAIAAGALTVGLLAGAAGTIVIGNASETSAVDRHYEQMGFMMEGIGDGDLAAMMEMMGGSMTGEDGGPEPGSSQHEAHHPSENR